MRTELLVDKFVELLNARFSLRRALDLLRELLVVQTALCVRFVERSALHLLQEIKLLVVLRWKQIIYFFPDNTVQKYMLK